MIYSIKIIQRYIFSKKRIYFTAVIISKENKNALFLNKAVFTQMKKPYKNECFFL